MGATYEAYSRLGYCPLAYGRWVELGCPTDRVMLVTEADRQRERLAESMAKLPVLQDSRGLHLDERPAVTVGADRRCPECGATFATELYGAEWVLPQHGHHSRERICAGSHTAGCAP